MPLTTTQCLLSTEMFSVPCFKDQSESWRWAAKVWFLQQALYLLGGNDYRNINTLLQNIVMRRQLSDSRLDSFRLYVYQNLYVAAGGTQPTLAQLAADIKCLGCVDNRQLRVAEVALLCEILQKIG